MSAEHKDWQFKLVLLGDGAVGKTSVRERYMGKGFSGSYLKTIGADFASNDVELGDHKIKLTIWDLAGQAAYAAVRSSFYAGGNGAFLVFDVQDPQSLMNLKTWIEEARTNSKDQIASYVVLGNKADLVESRQVANEYAHEILQRWAAETGINFWYGETSAKSGLNIGDAFTVMAAKLLSTRGGDFDISSICGDLVLVTSQGVQGAKSATAPAAAVAAAPAGPTVDPKVIEELKSQIDKLEKRVKKLGLVVKNVVQKLSKLEAAVGE